MRQISNHEHIQLPLKKCDDCTRQLALYRKCLEDVRQSGPERRRQQQKARSLAQKNAASLATRRIKESIN
jgi:hypothetical protein